ncbi:hypothetical protein [Paenisporosarcina sp. TG20]|uniref:hypothetical protein n=1 Tax=Paenisporosarcina sp. TG20 TaxID=1211706 RepID=UPI0002EB924E|nr:hypothetical protein [Paenisporosarcina sp. TG20]
MPVTEWFIIKSLTVPSSWIAVLLAILITGLVLWRKFGKTTEVWFSDAVILVLLVWKLSVIITDFKMILNSPLSILYFNGGNIGLYLGLLVALARLLYQFKKKGWPVSELVAMIIALVMVQSLYQFLMVLLNEAALWQKIITVVIFLGITILSWLKVAESSVWRIQLIILFLCAHIFVAVIQPEGIVQTPLFITGLFVIAAVMVYFATNSQHEYTEGNYE